MLGVCLFILGLFQESYSLEGTHYITDEVLPKGIIVAISISPNSLHYKKTINYYTAVITGRIVIRKNGGIVHSDTVNIITNANSGREALRKTISTEKYYNAEKGHYTIDCILFEPGLERERFSFSDTITIGDNHLSGIRIIDSILAVHTTGEKNSDLTYQYLTSNFLDNDKKLLIALHSYANNEANPIKGMPLVLKSYITKKEEERIPYQGLSVSHTFKNDDNSFFLDTFKVGSLPSGNYFLVTLLSDTNKVTIEKRMLFFQRLNTHPTEAPPSILDTAKSPITVINLSKTFVAKYSTEQIKAILKMIRPIAEPSELEAISGFTNNMDEVYSRYFIYNFFSKRDEKSPSDAWKAYSDKIRETNKLFGSTARAGYETERGFYYLRFGKPSERVEVTNEADTHPYEVWRYDKVGPDNQPGVLLFYKPSAGIGDYRILHSTINGEIHNPNWRNELYITNQGINNKRARIEEYIK